MEFWETDQERSENFQTEDGDRYEHERRRGDVLLLVDRGRDAGLQM